MPTLPKPNLVRADLEEAIKRRRMGAATRFVDEHDELRLRLTEKRGEIQAIEKRLADQIGGLIETLEKR